jgi:predicted DNA-binding transcriptional regulator YafY
MRASRLLSILVVLQARGHITAPELAGECEVSLRTIYRDIDSLSAAGIPVYSERGSGGGYRLLDGYRTQLNGLSAKEAEALFMTGLSGPAADLGLGAVMAGAQEKLLSAMPASLRSAAAQTRARFHLDAPAWFAQAEQPAHLPLVADAVLTQRPIRIHYQSWRAEKERIVEPLGLVLKGGAWYLVAQADGIARTYRVSRMRKAAVLDQRFKRPEVFNLVTYWQASTKRLEADLHQNVVTIRLSPWAVKMLEALLSPFVRAGTQLSPEADAEGWSTATMPVGSIPQACAELLRFGADAEVMEPPELRAKMSEVISRMKLLYERDKAGQGTTRKRNTP